MFRLAILGAALFLPGIAIAADNPGLASMERLLATSYNAALARAPNDAAKSRLSDEQRRWVAKQREVCATDTACLIRLDAQRVAVLQYDKMAAAWPKLPFRPTLLQGAETPLCKAIEHDLLASFYGSTQWLNPLGEREIEFRHLSFPYDGTEYRTATFDPYNDGMPFPIFQMIGDAGAEHFGSAYYRRMTQSVLDELVANQRGPGPMPAVVGEPIINNETSVVYADNPTPLQQFVTNPMVPSPEMPRFFRDSDHVYLYSPGVYYDVNGGVYDIASPTEIDQTCLFKTDPGYDAEVKKYEEIDKQAGITALDALAAPLLPHGQVCEDAGEDAYTRTTRAFYRPWALEDWPVVATPVGAANFNRYMTNRGLTSLERYRQSQVYRDARDKAIAAVARYYRDAFGREDAETRRLAALWLDQQMLNQAEIAAADPDVALFDADFAAAHRAAAAALAGDLAGLKTAIGGSPQKLGPFDETLLSLGLAHPDIVRALLDAGRNVDEPGASGRTPLMWAARLDLADAAALLIAHGAKPNLGAGPAVATLYSEGDVLCQKEGPPPAPDVPGRTALSYAAETGSPAMVALLIGKGADPTIAARDGHTPAFWASKRIDVAAAEIQHMLAAKK